MNKNVKKSTYVSKMKEFEDLEKRTNERLWENHGLIWKEVNICRREDCVKSEGVLCKSGRFLETKDEVCKKE